MPLQGASDHGVSEALYLDDPDGNGIELYRDRPREEWPRAADGSLLMLTAPLDLRGVASRRRTFAKAPVGKPRARSRRSRVPMTERRRAQLADLREPLAEPAQGRSWTMRRRPTRWIAGGWARPRICSSS